MQTLIEEVVDTNESYTWADWKKCFKEAGIKILDDDSGFTEEKILKASEARAAIQRCTCEGPIEESETSAWGSYKQDAESNGIKVMSDNSGVKDSDLLNTEEAIAAFKLCVRSKIIPQEISNSQESSTVVHVSSNEMTISEWRQAYDKVSNTPPINEYISAEQGPIRMHMELHPGSPPFIFTRVYIRNIVGVKPAWFAQGDNQSNSFGWKVILLPKARDEVIRRFGVANSILRIKMLRIVKISESRRSLLAEVVEW